MGQFFQQGRGPAGPAPEAYDDVRGRIRNGDVLLYRGKGLLSWAIRAATRSRYSHAGIAAWWNQRLIVLEAVGKGVVATPLSRNVGGYRGGVDWFTTGTELSEDQRLAIVRFAAEELGKEYSIAKVLKIGLYRLLGMPLDERESRRRSRRLFCSLYVAQAYRSVGLDLKIDAADRFTTPDDLARSPFLTRAAVIKRSR